MAFVEGEGFIVHAYADARRGKVHILGRLADGRSFACAKPSPERRAYVRAMEADRARVALSAAYLDAGLDPSEFRSFGGDPCFVLSSADSRSLERAVARLRAEGIAVLGAEERGAAAFLVRAGIRGGIGVSGEARAGRGVDLVFPDAAILPAHGARAPLSVLSFDIETEEPAGTVRAVGLVLDRGEGDRERRLLFAGRWGGDDAPESWVTVLPDEASLLRALLDEARRMDPDLVTGWNVIDFDFPRLAAAFARHGIPFALGRSTEPGAFFPSEGVGDDKRSASVFLPGRQVLDGLRLVRSGSYNLDSYTLDAVARETLGRGKTVSETGEKKLAELDRLYAERSLDFSRYCLADAELVLDILEAKGLVRLTVERAALTGVGIDKAWTSVASFERVYAEELRARGILEPEPEPDRSVSGAAGGTVLDPQAGIFRDVAVFDFRSLYPSVIRTFNVDPLAYELARVSGEGAIRAPNGAAFSREPGILPALIAEYFAERLAAIERKDDAGAQVYKILMNSFYGVLGSPRCRYARTELAGAITSFGKRCLLFARDFFEKRGLRVLYGDTDSVFVEFADGALAAELNEALAADVRETYGLESFISIRFEKLYRRFFIPRLRSGGEEGDEERGRAKGYAGLLAGDGGEIEIKGMEAARSDYTPLARRFQRELLGIVFRSEGTEDAERFVRDQTERLFRGEFDGELAFKKRLRRVPEDYVASTPPHIKVARALGWKGRKGTVEYVITVNGPEALSLRSSPLDYPWYALSQILPTARSVGLASGFDADAIVRSVSPVGQLEFDWPRAANEKEINDE